jgi:hypothetical protein
MDYKHIGFVVVSVLAALGLSAFSAISYRFLATKSNTLAKTVNDDFYRGLRVLAIWPLSFIVVLAIPFLVMVYLTDWLGTDRRLTLLWLFPSAIFMVYYGIKIARQNSSRG